jgi:hypothetical protein
MNSIIVNYMGKKKKTHTHTPTIQYPTPLWKETNWLKIIDTYNAMNNKKKIKFKKRK